MLYWRSRYWNIQYILYWRDTYWLIPLEEQILAHNTGGKDTGIYNIVYWRDRYWLLEEQILATNTQLYYTT